MGLNHKAAVIFNPRASQGKAVRYGDRIRACLESYCPDSWEVLEPTSAEGTTKAAKKLADEGWERIGVYGGDGTLSLAVRGIVDTNSAIAPIPGGTGNDFARSIGTPTNLEDAIRTLVHGEIWEADLIRSGSRISINSVACGFDAQVGLAVNAGTRLKGRSAYIGAILKTLSKFTPFKVEIQTDERSWTGYAMLCVVANAAQYGGGMKIAPMAEPFDGHMDIIVVQEMGKFELILKLFQVFSGSHISDPKVMAFQAKKATIMTEPSVPVLFDGDDGGETPFNVEIDPGAIKIIRP
jgi:YegS/Rv2252/BmrU family lipid kinase